MVRRVDQVFLLIELSLADTVKLISGIQPKILSLIRYQLPLLSSNYAVTKD